jgi:uncharacterized membrane protein
MLVHFPVGLLLASVVFDALSHLSTGMALPTVAYWMLAAGIVGGLAAAPFGLIDLLAIPVRTRASRIGTWHAVGNLVVLCLFICSWALRPSAALAAPLPAVALSMAGAALLLVTAWMGGEMVSRLGIGGRPHAHPDAPSSLLEPAVNPRRAGLTAESRDVRDALDTVQPRQPVPAVPAVPAASAASAAHDTRALSTEH